MVRCSSTSSSDMTWPPLRSKLLSRSRSQATPRSSMRRNDAHTFPNEEGIDLKENRQKTSRRTLTGEEFKAMFAPAYSKTSNDGASPWGLSNRIRRSAHPKRKRGLIAGSRVTAPRATTPTTRVRMTNEARFVTYPCRSAHIQACSGRRTSQSTCLP